MVIGYARVSTAEQNEARQIEALTKAGVELIYLDKLSGKNTERPKLQEMLAFVRKGDTLIVESFSRLARSTRDLLSIVDQLNKKEVTFVSQKETVNTATPQGRFMLTVFAAIAELERENILERQREGIEIAKRLGKYKGRKRIEVDEEVFRSVCARWRSGAITASKAMKILGLKRSTFYRLVKQYEV